MSWWRLQWNVCSYPTQSITAHLIHCCSTQRCQNWSGGCHGSAPPWRFHESSWGFSSDSIWTCVEAEEKHLQPEATAHMCKAVHELTCESLGLVFPQFWVWLELFPMVPSQIKSRNHTDSFILLPNYNPYKQYLLWLGAVEKIQIRLGFVSHEWFSQMYCISYWWHAHYGKGPCRDDMYEGGKCWLLWDQKSGQSPSLLQIWNHSGQISPYHHSGTELLFHHMVCKSSQVLHSYF